jgi:hypothetical protein
LVLAPEGCRYLALSYVWGGNSTPSVDLKINENLPNNLPRIIEDSVTVANNLGIFYLWVDRYCIPQNDKSTKHNLIRQMDRIYQNAESTIVAAAGANPDYGIPGVSTPRILRPTAAAQGITLLSTLGDPRSHIKASKWMSRAWTYQEAIFSKRRFVFTDEQVYFECGNMCCYESLLSPADTDTKIKPRFKWAGNHRLFPANGVGHWPWEILTRIEEYTERSLSYDSDILNRALGVLRAFEDMKYPIRHYWGVPILTPVDDVNGLVVKSLRGSKEGFIVGLCSFVLKPSTRRCGFPSWSGTGWFGGVINSKTDYTWRPTRSESRTSREVTISVELRNGEVMQWEEFEQGLDIINSPSLVTPFLHIEAWTLQVSFRHFSADSARYVRGSRFFAEYDFGDGYVCTIPENIPLTSRDAFREPCRK